jgi:DNA-binding transcriptional regulator YiaG
VAPGLTTIKSLFALSGNTCFYRGCEETLTDPAWKEVNAEIAHICGQSAAWARFDSAMTAKERHGFDNLMLLCPKHHKLIDRLEPDSHSAERLRAMKAEHEEAAYRPGARSWADDEVLERFARALITATRHDRQPRSDEPAKAKYPGKLGAKLRELRKARGLTAEEVALRLNCTPSTISKWELGRSVPSSTDTWHGMADLFDIPYEEVHRMIREEWRQVE